MAGEVRPFGAASAGAALAGAALAGATFRSPSGWWPLASVATEVYVLVFVITCTGISKCMYFGWMNWLVERRKILEVAPRRRGMNTFSG